MINVRVLRGVKAGVTGMSGLVALSSGLAACAADEVNAEDFDTSESALTVMNPGTGVFDFTWAYGTPSGYTFAAKNSIDEFVRAGEKMSFNLPALQLWQRLYPNDPYPNDVARLKQLSATVKIIYVKDGAVYASTSVKTTGWTGSQLYDTTATTNTFIVSRRAQGLRFEVTVTDAADATKKVVMPAEDFLEVPVFGGTLPNKTMLFDTMGSSFRQRVVEGGSPVRGSTLAIAYSDWRAGTLVDSYGIDRTIGNATSYGRFGSFQMPIQGELEYEISYAVAIDGVWQAEQALSRNDKSRIVSGFGRVAYEGTLAIPKTAQKIEVYFHVKTFLKVDYDRFSNVGWRKYNQGERILVREKWDNENGAVYDNYDFSTEKR